MKNQIKKEEKSSHFTFDAWLIRLQETDGFITLFIMGKKRLKGLFRCKFNPCSNTLRHRVGPPVQEIKFAEH